jgi:hypothetical protein
MSDGGEVGAAVKQSPSRPADGSLILDDISGEFIAICACYYFTMWIESLNNYMILAETPDNTRKHMPFDSVSQPVKITELTLADVLAALQAGDLPNQQRQELASALRTVGRASAFRAIRVTSRLG